MTSASDPFRAGPDVNAYVRRAETEENCRYLTAKVEDAPTIVGICGGAGVGKTLLLRLLLNRVGSGFTRVYVPTGGITACELGRWVAAELKAPLDAATEDLARDCLRARRPLLLAIDEAQLCGVELVSRLEALCVAEFGVRAVLAWTQFDRSVPPPLARCAARVFVEPFELGQVPAYVEAQLDRVNAAPELRAVLAGRTRDRIALASGGNPRAIQRLADAELTAHAWRAQRGEPLRGSGYGQRTTNSAPRSALGSGGEAARSRGSPSRVALRVAGALAALVATALWFSR